ncbi:MAG: hypothetical protein ACSLEM_01960 [Candidatus Malihini olakiniferum]
MAHHCIGRGKSLQDGGAIYSFTGPPPAGVWCD